MKVTTLTFDAVKSLSKPQKYVYNFIKMQESEGDLANVRFVQDTAVNWAPKAVFSRSVADFADMSFLEFMESLQVYYGPKILGENLFRKIYSKKLNPDAKKILSTPAEKLINENSKHKDDLMPVKAAIAVSALAIPLMEYSLNYVKNIFTLKLFKQADFNNIANLNKNKSEDKQKQDKVKKSAKKHIKIAAGLLSGCLALSALLVVRGKKSASLKYLSELILAPGNKIFKNKEKAASFNKCFSIDFKDDNGKLGLSRGQLTACVLAGFFGYTGAAKDRGNQNFKEVLYRYPLVGLYVITGSEKLEEAFKMVLRKNPKYKDIIDEKLKVPGLKALPELAKSLAEKNQTSQQFEYKKLFKQKAMITAVPFFFGIGFMGLFVAGISRYFTQYRFAKEQEKAKNQH